MSYKIIPESILRESAFVLMGEGEEDNSFVRLLESAEKFRKADMTPIYVLDTTTMFVAVVAKETFRKKLH